MWILKVIFSRAITKLGNFHTPLPYRGPEGAVDCSARGTPFSIPPEVRTTLYISFQPGLLLIFPSYLMHSVPMNNTKYVRKSVSMNILPKGKIGDVDSLTELIFDKVV